jgi:hypothetical protein
MFLQALDAEELGPDWFFPLDWSNDDGVAGVHFELSF